MFRIFGVLGLRLRIEVAPRATYVPKEAELYLLGSGRGYSGYGSELDTAECVEFGGSRFSDFGVF